MTRERLYKSEAKPSPERAHRLNADVNKVYPTGADNGIDESCEETIKRKEKTAILPSHEGVKPKKMPEKNDGGSYSVHSPFSLFLPSFPAPLLFILALAVYNLPLPFFSTLNAPHILRSCGYK